MSETNVLISEKRGERDRNQGVRYSVAFAMEKDNRHGSSCGTRFLGRDRENEVDHKRVAEATLSR